MKAYDQRQDAWILVSHSHCDLEKDNQISNELERHGHYSRAETRGRRGERLMNEDWIGTIIIEAAIEAHRNLGPGLLEGVYETVLSNIVNVINKHTCKCHCEGDSPKQSPGFGLLHGVYTEQSECARNDGFMRGIASGYRLCNDNFLFVLTIGVRITAGTLINLHKIACKLEICLL